MPMVPTSVQDSMEMITFRDRLHRTFWRWLNRNFRPSTHVSGSRPFFCSRHAIIIRHTSLRGAFVHILIPTETLSYALIHIIIRTVGLNRTSSSDHEYQTFFAAHPDDLAAQPLLYVAYLRDCLPIFSVTPCSPISAMYMFYLVFAYAVRSTQRGGRDKRRVRCCSWRARIEVHATRERGKILIRQQQPRAGERRRRRGEGYTDAYMGTAAAARGRDCRGK